MNMEKVYQMKISKVYPLLLNKAVKKGRTKDEVDEIICWLTGYSRNQLLEHLQAETTYGDFFRNAPVPNPARNSIRGVICGVRVETIEEPLMREIRYLDKLIDDLATYLPIDVVYGEEVVGGSFKVETMSIKLKDDFNNPPEDAYLIQDDQAGSLKYSIDPATGESKIDLEYLDSTGNIRHDTDAADKFTEGILKGNLDMLNKEGIFDGSDVKGIGYYQKMFDSFVNTLATKMNEMNTFTDGLGNNLYDGGPLFEAEGGGTITAANIKISDGWMDGTVRLVADETDDPDNTSGKNILKMSNLLSTDTIEFMGTNSSGVSIQVFKGTMPGAYANIQAEQGIEKKSTESILDNRVTVLANSADARDSVMGVNMDEEVMNLMRYQQSYSAAARLMTTMDEALDKLINNTGVVGR